MSLMHHPEVAEALDSRIDDALVLQLEHTWMKGMIDLLKDEAGWELITGRGSGQVADSERVANVELAQMFALKDPLCRRTLQLYRDMCFGKRFRLVPREDSPHGDAATDFWRSRDNRPYLGFLGQRNLCDRLLTDGEQFAAIWNPGKGGDSYIRFHDVLEIRQIISNPDDASEPWWYCREWAPTDAEGNPGPTHKVAYPAASVENPVAIEDALPGGYVPAYAHFNGVKMGSVIVMHTAINNPYGGRGNSLFTGAFGAAKHWRTFIESRAAVALAIARHAMKKKHAKAGPAQVAAMAAADQSALVTGDTETRPAPAFGANLHEGGGTETTAMPQQTGGSDATQNAALFIARFGQFTGFPPYFYGVETLSRMATADQMSRPVREMLEAWQLLWATVFGEWVGLAVDPEEDPDEIAEFDYQSITEEDLLAAVKTATPIGRDLPAVYEQAEYLTWMFDRLGLKDPEGLAETILKAAAEEEKNKPEPPPQPPAPQQPEEIAQSLVGLAKAARYMREEIEGPNGNDDDQETAAGVAD